MSRLINDRINELRNKWCVSFKNSTLTEEEITQAKSLSDSGYYVDHRNALVSDTPQWPPRCVIFSETAEFEKKVNDFVSLMKGLHSFHLASQEKNLKVSLNKLNANLDEIPIENNSIKTARTEIKQDILSTLVQQPQSTKEMIRNMKDMWCLTFNEKHFQMSENETNNLINLAKNVSMVAFLNAQNELVVDCKYIQDTTLFDLDIEKIKNFLNNPSYTVNENLKTGVKELGNITSESKEALNNFSLLMEGLRFFNQALSEVDKPKKALNNLANNLDSMRSKLSDEHFHVADKIQERSELVQTSAKESVVNALEKIGKVIQSALSTIVSLPKKFSEFKQLMTGMKTSNASEGIEHNVTTDNTEKKTIMP